MLGWPGEPPGKLLPGKLGKPGKTGKPPGKFPPGGNSEREFSNS